MRTFQSSRDIFRHRMMRDWTLFFAVDKFGFDYWYVCKMGMMDDKKKYITSNTKTLFCFLMKELYSLSEDVNKGFQLSARIGRIIFLKKKLSNSLFIH